MQTKKEGLSAEIAADNVEAAADKKLKENSLNKKLGKVGLN